MEIPLHTSKLLDTIRSGRDQWDSLLAKINTSDMTQSGAKGTWSIKDIIAHITWYELEIVTVLQEHVLAGSDLWNLTQEERNEAINKKYLNSSLKEVLAESKETIHRLLEAIQSLSQDELMNPRYYRNMPEEWVPWELIAENTYKHYQQHIHSLREWLERRKV